MSELRDGGRDRAGRPGWLAALSHAGPSLWLAGMLRRCGVSGRGAVIVPPLVWLLLFFLVPFVIVLKISFAETQLAVPPYTPLVEWTDGRHLQIHLHANSYVVKPFDFRTFIKMMGELGIYWLDYNTNLVFS